MEIANMKPFWLAQAFSGDRLADFICMKEQLRDMTEGAADFMDFEVKHRTNFRYRMEQAVDTMLLRGRGILKIVFDHITNKICFRSIDPLFIIMAEQYDDFEDADWFVEVQTLTVQQYRRNRNYSQNEDVINAIRGKSEPSIHQVQLEKQLREGITHSTKEDTVILWNLYERTASGWLVRTHSPTEWNKQVREPYPVTLEVDGEKLLPFYSMTMEIKDEGWYSPRGLAELNAAFEAYCTKLWNEKSDAMTFGNKPIFTSDNEIQNPGNVRFLPGEIVPGGIRAVEMPQPAYSFADEINFTRQVSEQRSKMPDYGIYQPGESGNSKPRTATENERIAAMQDVGADHNGDIFRNVYLKKIYRHIWALICHREELAKDQGKIGPLTYFVGDSLKQLPPDAMHNQYLVTPAGGSGTKMQRLNRAVGRYTMFVGKPNIDQDELAKDVIASDDARLVNRLLLPQNMRQGEEAEDEAKEIGVMLLGFPAQVNPGDDHLTRINVLVGFLEKQGMSGAPVDPLAVQRLQQHLVVHMTFLMQINPKAAKQFKQRMMMQDQPQNVEAMPAEVAQ